MAQLRQPLAGPYCRIGERAGHFTWLDRPERYWPMVTGFLAGD